MNESNTLKYKRIVFVTISMTGGGTERVIATLANHYAKMDYSVSIIMIAGDQIAYDLDDRIRIKSLGGSSGGSLKARIRRIVKLRREIAESAPCNIIAMGSVCGIFSSFARLLIPRTHLIISERNNPYRINKHDYSLMLRVVRNILYGLSDGLVLQSDDSRKAFPTKIGKSAAVICNPLPDGIKEPYTGNRDDKIVAAGRLTDDKNYPMLIKAFEIFWEEHQTFALYIYGSGEKKANIENLINKTKCAENIHLVPFTPTLHDEICSAKVYVSSSNSEGISNSIMEALALGLPVVATDCPIGGSRLLVHNDINGCLVRVGDVEGLAKKLSYIADNQSIAAMMSTNALAIRNECSTTNIADKWLSIMK